MFAVWRVTFADEAEAKGCQEAIEQRKLCKFKSAVDLDRITWETTVGAVFPWKAPVSKRGVVAFVRRMVDVGALTASLRVSVGVPT